MGRETTPAKVTDKIMELCSRAVPGAAPVYVPVEAAGWCQLHECFPNVQRMVREQGGRQVNGWAIWQWANMMVEAEAHSIWENPDGELIDITPHDNGEKEILFLHDGGMEYSGESVGNIRLAITGSPLVAELIELGEKTDAVMCEYKPGTGIPLSELRRRLLPLRERREAIMGMLNQKAGRNDPCPCQSGLKYKKCCGRNW